MVLHPSIHSLDYHFCEKEKSHLILPVKTWYNYVMVRSEIEGDFEQGLRRKCGHKIREVAGGWISYIPTKYIIFTLYQLLVG